MKSQTKPVCAWCEPGTPGSHGICEKHKAQLLADYRRDCESEQAARTFCDLERARSYRYPMPVRNDDLETAWNAPETGWSALKWLGFGALLGLGAILMVLAMAWEGSL